MLPPGVSSDPPDGSSVTTASPITTTLSEVIKKAADRSFGQKLILIIMALSIVFVYTCICFFYQRGRSGDADEDQEAHADVAGGDISDEEPPDTPSSPESANVTGRDDSWAPTLVRRSIRRQRLLDSAARATAKGFLCSGEPPTPIPSRPLAEWLRRTRPNLQAENLDSL